ncbi:DUF2846 domain-containing protein [Shewanella litorisediminis]|uniref:DUF2846 domain-containing protein n=1 Tax=Shewanella litorisediminis TaxID=1173586 RepID=A0ABX7G3V1_9GAMM|nr:DUF2846 domain-containing protein [Shewanella litorisediminis]MCL2919389.1 DUF2846 domain-containing protein [Shewanella litorisediminis]QRH01996.1 DUF2846 domain-containing protein [Shewanella litorisediminis]
MFKIESIFTSFFAIAILAGCATVPMADKSRDAALKEFQKPTKNFAGLYIYRDTFAGQALKKSVYINGKLIGETANKTFFYQELTPGTHVISTESEFSENELSINVESGKNYFVEQYLKMGVFVGGAGLKLVESDKGMNAVKKCRLAKEAETEVYLKKIQKN